MKILKGIGKLIVGLVFIIWAVITGAEKILEICDYATDDEFCDRIKNHKAKDEPEKRVSVVLSEEDYQNYRRNFKPKNRIGF